MTDPHTLKVAVPHLIDYARERYEDSYAFHAVMYYVADVGAVPDFAWGHLPWSAQWRKDWAIGLESRVTEAKTIRDEVATTAGKLLQVAADYSDTDVQSALTLDLTNQDTLPYFHKVLGDGATPVARPGGSYPTPVFPVPPAGTSLREFFDYPAGNERLDRMRNEKLPELNPAVITNPGEPLSATSRAHLEPVEDDELSRFVDEHQQVLFGIDQALQRLEPGATLPFADVILPAWKCCPSIVRNRADLLSSAGNTYRDLHSGMTDDRAWLARSWASPGAAAAFFLHEKSIRQYLESIKAEVDWLAAEGGRAADLLQSLRTRYADIGYEHMKDGLQEKYEKYVATGTAMGRLVECSTPGGAAAALVSAAATFAAAMVAEEIRKLEAAQRMLAVEDIVRAGQLNAGSRAHDARPFIESELGAGSWEDGNQWAPEQGPGGAP